LSDSGENPSGNRRNVLIYVLAVAATVVILWSVLGNFIQTMAGTVFIATVLGTLAFWRFRLAIAFAGIGILLATQTLDVEHMLAFMNLDVILFLISMMIVVYVANESGFFTWLLGKILRVTKYDPKKVFIILMLLSTAMAAMVDEVTSILFIIAIVFEYCQYFELPPLPYVISCVIATNIGSAATMLGNPVGILIGIRAGLTFEDFLLTATPVVLMSLIAVIGICLFWYRKFLKESTT
jgi:Na+/H+ antiporter NhaD/arsenite permease-like protein